MTLVAVDPDTKTSGVAFFNHDGRLVDIFDPSLDRNLRAADAFDAARCWLRSGDKLVIECPQTYDGRAAGGSDANVLVRLARVVGRFEQIADDAEADVVVVSPREWKGNAPKHITIQRAFDLLIENEKAIVASAVSSAALKRLSKGEGIKSGYSADAMDAVALGLWALKRKAPRLGRIV